MTVLDVNVRRDVLLCGVVLPASVLTACLCYWKSWLYLTVLPVVVFIGTVIAESVEEFVHGKPSQTVRRRVQPTVSVMRISRALYNQIDNDMLQLLASSRDFDESDTERLLQLDSVRFGGATKTEISRLPLVVVTEQMLEASDRAECSICLAHMALGSQSSSQKNSKTNDEVIMGLGSKAFSTEKLESLLRGAKVTQQSIQSVSHWMLEHRAFLSEMVDVWTQLLREGDASHQIVNLYIANDAMQVGARKYGKYVAEAFETQLLSVAEFIMASCDEKVKRCLMKIVGIWKQRNIVTPNLLQMLQNVCAGKPAVDPTAETAATPSTLKNDAAECDAALAEMLSAASIERALDDLPEVPESEYTSTTAARLQSLSSATISADLLSDRMFQLESSLSAFHHACDAFATKASSGEDAGFEVVDASAGAIVWELLEPHVFDVDVDKSRDHVQQYRDHLETQSAMRDDLLAYLDDLAQAELFCEPLFAPATSTDSTAMDALTAQCATLETLYRVCVEAEVTEKQREAEAQAAYAASSRSSHDDSLYNSSTGRSMSDQQRYGYHTNDAYASGGGKAPIPLRRHSSGGSTSSSSYYERDYSAQSKRPKLQHAHSVDSGSFSRTSRWEPRRSEPLGDSVNDCSYRPPVSYNHHETHYSPRDNERPQSYYQQPQYQQQQAPYHHRHHRDHQEPYQRSSSRWDARPPPGPDRSFEARDRRW